jgi:hypothetical protein
LSILTNHKGMPPRSLGSTSCDLPAIRGSASC